MKKSSTLINKRLPSDSDCIQLKILTPKQMLQRLSISLAQVKAGNTYENLLNELDKSHILCIKQKKLLKSIQQYNELNKVIKQNGYYINEF